ncbi:MAG: hypothetical protein JWN44_6942 [Myxococcales bacterium]|nr:hypothetical protein [Myxococcales bacterium]
MEAYLASLAGGLEAHPECLGKGSIARSVLAKFPIDKLPKLPGPVQALVDSPPPSSLWIPEVHANALFLAICDAQFPDDESYLAFSLDFNRALLRSALYRIVMFVASPTQLLKTAGMQWNALHRGSTMNASLLVTGNAVSQLNYPIALFPPLMVRSFATAQRAVVEGSGGKDVVVELRGHTATRAEFDVRWK